MLSRSRPSERTPRDDSGALPLRFAGWALLGGLGWFAGADVVAVRFQFGVRGLLALESVYVFGVSSAIFFLARGHHDVAPVLARRRSLAESSELVRRLAQVAALHDGDTALHCERIGALAYELAIEVGMSRRECERLRRAAVLHDLGKIGIDRSILLKPGPLDEWERTEVRKHVEFGAALLEGADDPVLGCALVAINAHHEWWNGNGYPRGLTGENIPLEGRIVAVCDVFDALATDRPYHPRLSPHVALGIVCANAGLQFDPDIVDAFARCFPRVLDLYESEVPSGATASVAPSIRRR